MTTLAEAPLVAASLLRRMFPTGRDLDSFAIVLSRAAPLYGVTTPARLAAFLAQTGHESAGYARWVENLNYSAKGLVAIWPRRFRDPRPGESTTARVFADGLRNAAAYARQPEAIANAAYADRMGNGPEASGDGWRFRGRGLIQLTGRDNYQRCATALGRPIESMPAWLEAPEGAAVSALWWWSAHGCNEIADAGDVEALTKRINGGLHGLEERRALHVLATKLLGA